MQKSLQLNGCQPVKGYQGDTSESLFRQLYDSLSDRHLKGIRTRVSTLAPFSLPDRIAVSRSDLVVGECLGRGGFCEVRAVSSKDKNSDGYVIKQLKPTTSSERLRTAVTDLFVEARILAHCDHEHIVEFQGYSKEGRLGYNGYPFSIIIEKIEETLDTRIDQWRDEISGEKQSGGRLGRLKPRNVAGGKKERLVSQVKTAMEIARGLAYLHQNMILHRDLKPANIGFRDNKVKIFDFGLSRKLPGFDADGTYLMSFCGTKRYIAPEVLKYTYYGLKADVYSYAIVLNEMLTLEKPFFASESSWGSLQNGIIRGRKRPQTIGVPRQFLPIVKSAWKSDPKLRPSMENLAEVTEKIKDQLSK